MPVRALLRPWWRNAPVQSVQARLMPSRIEYLPTDDGTHKTAYHRPHRNVPASRTCADGGRDERALPQAVQALRAWLDGERICVGTIARAYESPHTRNDRRLSRGAADSGAA